MFACIEEFVRALDGKSHISRLRLDSVATSDCGRLTETSLYLLETFTKNCLGNSPILSHVEFNLHKNINGLFHTKPSKLFFTY